MMNPVNLPGSFWYGLAACGAHDFDRLLDTDPGGHQHPGRNQSGTPNALAAMNGNILSFFKCVGNVSQ